MQKHESLQAGCSSCQPINSIKALEGFTQANDSVNFIQKCPSLLNYAAERQTDRQTNLTA